VSDPRELYQQVIIEHNKKPRNYGDLEGCTHHAHGLNPLCGDDIELKVVVQDGIVRDLRFTGQGCAISKASSSLMTVQVKGRPVAEAQLPPPTPTSWASSACSRASRTCPAG